MWLQTRHQGLQKQEVAGLKELEISTESSAHQGSLTCVSPPLQQPRAGDSSRLGRQVLVLSVWSHCVLGAAAGPRKSSVLRSGLGAALSLNTMLVHSQQRMGEGSGKEKFWK